VSSDRTALLIIRAWIEPGSAEPLRAQVRLIADVSEGGAGGERTVNLTRTDAVCATVREWLDDLLKAVGPMG